MLTTIIILAAIYALFTLAVGTLAYRDEGAAKCAELTFALLFLPLTIAVKAGKLGLMYCGVLYLLGAEK